MHSVICTWKPCCMCLWSVLVHKRNGIMLKCLYAKNWVKPFHYQYCTGKIVENLQLWCSHQSQYSYYRKKSHIYHQRYLWNMPNVLYLNQYMSKMTEIQDLVAKTQSKFDTFCKKWNIYWLFLQMSFLHVFI